MGFNIKTTELLIESKKLGINFSSVGMLGRQTLNGSFFEFQKLFERFGFPAENIIKRDNRYSEPFLTILGAKKIESFDASNYEGATNICDMNLPIESQYKEKYSLMIDSGSLEHIFNFPQAIKNCMEMVKQGGHMIGVTPANNFFGHGFYQFSPELFFRIFSETNGFEIEKMWLFFPFSSSKVYEVKDPAAVKSRVSLMNTTETFLFYIAKRKSVKTIFSRFPQQSDYENQKWNQRNEKKLSRKLSIPNFLIPIGLWFLKTWKRLKTLIYPLGTANRSHFKKIDF